jgi:KEOPS complex subunit Pcc1
VTDADPAHVATLSFDAVSAPDGDAAAVERARIVADAVGVEVGEIDDDRSRASVRRDGQTVVVEIVADDLVALRAACNTWTGLVEVAETACGLVDDATDHGTDPASDDG